MNYMEQLLSYGPTAIIVTLLLFFALVEAVKGAKVLVEFFGYESKDTKRFKALEARIDSQAREIAELKEASDTYKKNREHDREQSFGKQKEIMDNFSSVVTRIEGIDSVLEFISSQINENEEKRKQSERARLKDRIGQYYKYYHEHKTWNSMEREALEDLIREYENAGGENSFVHSVVQKEMYTWTEV